MEMVIRVKDSYLGFSYIYDDLMDDFDYDGLVKYIEEIFKKNNINPKLILDLACGTGTLCIKMTQRGYDMIGLDISTDMLSVAKRKTQEKGLDILYINQNMSEFELYGTVDAIICTMDSINYLLDESELISLFKNIKNYLNPNGIFIFDINTRHRLKNTFGQNVFVEHGDDIFYVWENNYYDDNNVCEFDLTFFVRKKDKYLRINEYHAQRAYEIDEIGKYLNMAGLHTVNIFNDKSFDDIDENSNKVFFVAKV
jgi:SAM-dependent methyltransferase